MNDVVMDRRALTSQDPAPPEGQRRICGTMALCVAAGILFHFASGGVCDHAAAEPARSMQPRGVVQALREADLTTDIGNPVAALPFRSGEAFREGDVLVVFDCARRRAELQAAKARQKEAKLVLESNTYLERRQALAVHDVEISHARMEQAAAEVAALEAGVSRCEFRAPFAGRIADLDIHRYETPNPSKPFMRIVGEKEFEIKLIVPSDWLRWIRNGLPFDFAIDEIGKTMRAHVVGLGGEIDPISQTLTVFGRFSDETDDVVPGMSGYAVFAPVGG